MSVGMLVSMMMPAGGPPSSLLKWPRYIVCLQVHTQGRLARCAAPGE